MSTEPTQNPPAVIVEPNALDGELDPARLKRFQENKAAWSFFQDQPPGYQKKLAWWVMQARQDATRDRRLLKLIDASARKRRLE